MNKRTALVLSIATLLCCALPGFAQVHRTITKMDTIPFGSGGSVSLTGAPKGSIKVIGSTKNEVQITAEIIIEAATEADLDRIAPLTGFVTDEGTALMNIMTVGPHNKFLARKLPKNFPNRLLSAPVTVNYVISVPRYCDLQIDGGIGDLTVKGVEGSLRANVLESNALVELIGGEATLLVGNGTADVTFGSRGWRGRSADIQVGKGDLIVRLPTTLSAELDAVVLRSGSIENTFPNLKMRDRKAPFTDRSIGALAGVGGAKVKFTVGEGTLKILTLTSQ